MLIVLVVFYSGLLLFFISGPSMDDVDSLRKMVLVVAFLAVVACAILIFVGLPVFSIGSADEPPEEAGERAPVIVEEEVLPEESPATAGDEPRKKAATRRKAPSKRKTPRRSTRERPSADEG